MESTRLHDYTTTLCSPSQGHLHWVSADEAVPATVRVFSVLFDPEDPEGEAAVLGTTLLYSYTYY